MAARIVMVLSNGLSSDPRVEKEAAALRVAGHEVTVLAWDRSGALPRLERRDGVGIERIGPPARHGSGLRNLPLYRTFWTSASRRIQELEPDVVHCHDLDTAPVGLRWAGRHPRPRLVLDFHELYRESNMMPRGAFVRGPARAAVRVLERRALRAASAVLVANPGTLDYYRAIDPAAHLVPIENAPDAAVFRPQARPRPPRPFTIGFMGQMRYLEGLRMLIDVVRADGRLAAVLAGGGTVAADVTRLAQGAERIEVSGPFSYGELPDLYARCDAVFAVYDTSLGNVRTLFPVKMMEAMACGLPSIVAAGTWAGDYASENGVGVTVDPNDAASLAAALAGLAADPIRSAEMGRRGRAIVEGGLNWASVSERLVGVYTGLLA